MSFDRLQVAQNNDILLDIPAFDVIAGSNIALVGRNGAGKTTLLESILGLRKLSQGQISFRCDKRQLGVQLQNSTYNAEFLVNDILHLHRALYRKSNNELYKAFNLDQLANKKYGHLSRGQKQRIDLYVAVAHNPSTLILDEPGTGLDKHYLDNFFCALEQLQQQNCFTLLMASHSEEELLFATDILWIDHGMIIQFDNKKTLLKQNLGNIKAHIKFENNFDLNNLICSLKKEGMYRNIRFLSAHNVIIFGESSLRKTMLDIASKETFIEFSIKETCEEDFLALVSENIPSI